MSKLVVSTYVTLDGVIDSPQEWSLKYFDKEAEAFASEQLFAADALLLGRETYEGFVQAWPPRGGEFADRMNRMPKYVASTTLDEPLEWNAKLITGDLIEEVSRIKRDESLLTYGSGRLARTLLEHGLIDEHRLWVTPVVWGSGARLLEGATETKVGELIDAQTIPSGQTILTYGPAEEE